MVSAVRARAERARAERAVWVRLGSRFRLQGFGSRVQGGAGGVYVYPGRGEVCGGTGDVTGVLLGLLVRNGAGRG